MLVHDCKLFKIPPLLIIRRAARLLVAAGHYTEALIGLESL